MPPRMLDKYVQEVAPALKAEFGLRNPMEIPRLVKVVVNIGVGEAIQNAKLIQSAEESLGQITGQKPVVNRARRSIAGFKLRAGMPIGVSVTLRRAHMYEFLDRLMNIALPRVRDFKGVSARGFDGRGNFTMGMREQIVFPEIDYDNVEKVLGLNVTVVTTARTDEQARALLRHLGMPFRN